MQQRLREENSSELKRQILERAQIRRRLKSVEQFQDQESLNRLQQQHTDSLARAESHIKSKQAQYKQELEQQRRE